MQVGVYMVYVHARVFVRGCLGVVRFRGLWQARLREEEEEEEEKKKRLRPVRISQTTVAELE